ncbi:unnamed protein product [Phytophthora lilii]|uniref:Unnamed protein product n=1 Tax=Phytophthora lilii TaxID=2077276 RepID=A0A9W7CMJ5_9STRA|nr:unnamed protein product [Phytophthora lilii]
MQILTGSDLGASWGTAAAVDQLVPKAGAWQFIDSVSVIVDGVTVQTNQIHENVNTTLKTLTEWSVHDERKYGATSQFGLDRYDLPARGYAQSLENVPTANFIRGKAANGAGENVGEFGLCNSTVNEGARQRSFFTGVSSATGSLAYDVMGSVGNASIVAKPMVYVAPSTTAATTGKPLYVLQYIATIRLADICDFFKKCPMSKNVKGFVYINYNSSEAIITTGGSAGAVDPTSITSVVAGMRFGNTCPVMYNYNPASASTGAAAASAFTSAGLVVPASTKLTITADIDGTEGNGIGMAPSQKFCRLLVPTYTPNPSADHALVQRKTFRYFERMTNKFTVQPNASFNFTLTNGIANPKKLFLCPVITNPSLLLSSTTSDVINPYRSPLTTIPATMSAFASLKNLQVTVGNLPIWNSPINFGYDAYVQEVRESSGVDGGLDDVINSRLLSQQDWESLYRFIPIDIGRRLPSEDGTTKSIVVSGVNNTQYALTVFYHVWRDAIATIDTSTGTISQGATQT